MSTKQQFVALMKEKQYIEAGKILLEEIKKNAPTKLQKYIEAENNYQLIPFSKQLEEKFEEFLKYKEVENDQLMQKSIEEFEFTKGIKLSEQQKKRVQRKIRFNITQTAR